MAEVAAFFPIQMILSVFQSKIHCIHIASNHYYVAMIFEKLTNT